jgi:HD-like signal output (HDOD) protein
MNITIMRAFARLRQIIATNKDIASRVKRLESGHQRTASVIEVLVEDIDRLAKEVRLMKALPTPRKARIGFRS